ncbi:MAG: amidohydrolase family protein [Eubacteriales bacterium]|nr:amidohydrolase family protein [Eubacteriales bacterium]
MPMTTAEKLFESIAVLPIMDTHEHVPLRQQNRELPCDVLTEFLSHYFDKDLLSAGMPRNILDHARNPELPIADRFRALSPWWDLCRHTGYGRSLDLSARGVYGIEKITGDTIEELNARFQAGVENPHHYRHVLKDLCHIDRSIVDCPGYRLRADDYDAQLFLLVKRLDPYLSRFGQVNDMVAYTGIEISDFDSFLAAVTRDIQNFRENGYVGFKLGVAYERPLHFARVEKAVARELFSGALKAIQTGQPYQAPLALQDYILHHCLSVISTLDTFIQVHTGYQEGNGNMVAHSDPLLLNNLFLEYPQIQFDLFHIGYPYVAQVGVLAKLFANVSVDFAWANIISPTAAENALCEYLDLVPRNKILAFGGDYLFVDGIYGHQLMARRMVSRALARKVDGGQMDEDEALATAKLLLHDNALNRLGLSL